MNFLWSQDFKKLEPVKRYKEIQGKDLEWAMAWFNSGSETKTNERMGYRGDRYQKAEILKWKHETENSEEWKIIKVHHFHCLCYSNLIGKAHVFNTDISSSHISGNYVSQNMVNRETKEEKVYERK